MTQRVTDEQLKAFIRGRDDKAGSIARDLEDARAEIAALKAERDRLAGVVVATGTVENVNDNRWYVKTSDGTFHFTTTNLTGFNGQRVEVVVRKAADETSTSQGKQ